MWRGSARRASLPLGASHMAYNRFEHLKQTLVEAKDFMVPWDMFHDHFASDPRFITFGQPATSERIEQCLESIARGTLGEAHRPRELRLIQISDYHFWHGACQLGPRVAIFFYFDDIEVGLAGLMRTLTDPHVTLARLTSVELDPRAPALPGQARLGGRDRTLN